MANNSGASSRDVASRFSLMAMRGSSCGRRQTGSPAWARPRPPPSRRRSGSEGRRPAVAATAWCRCASSRPRRSARRWSRRGSRDAAGSIPGRAAASAGCAPDPTAGCARRCRSGRRRRSSSGEHLQRRLERQRAPILQAFLLLRGRGESQPRRRDGVTRSELQVVAGVADLVDEHDPGVEPPRAVDAVEGVAVVAGHDDLQRQVRRRLGDAVVGPAMRGSGRRRRRRSGRCWSGAWSSGCRPRRAGSPSRTSAGPRSTPLNTVSGGPSSTPQIRPCANSAATPSRSPASRRSA